MAPALASDNMNREQWNLKVGFQGRTSMMEIASTSAQKCWTYGDVYQHFWHSIGQRFGHAALTESYGTCESALKLFRFIIPSSQAITYKTNCLFSPCGPCGNLPFSRIDGAFWALKIRWRESGRTYARAHLPHR